MEAEVEPRGRRRVTARDLATPLDGALVALERVDAARARWLVEFDHLRAVAPGSDSSRELASRRILARELERALADVLADLAESRP